MARRLLCIIFVLTLFIFSHPKTFAQDTFGPICDTTTPGVTCVPTYTPAPTNTVAPTNTPLPTNTPRPTATPRPPVTGTVENTILLLGISGIFTIIGISALLFPQKN